MKTPKFYENKKSVIYIIKKEKEKIVYCIKHLIKNNVTYLTRCSFINYKEIKNQEEYKYSIEEINNYKKINNIK